MSSYWVYSHDTKRKTEVDGIDSDSAIVSINEVLNFERDPVLIFGDELNFISCYRSEIDPEKHILHCSLQGYSAFAVAEDFPSFFQVLKHFDFLLDLNIQSQDFLDSVFDD